MHKMAMEIIKSVITEAKTIGCDNMTPDDWCKFEHAITGAAKAICAEKDYQIIEAMKKAEEEDKIEEAAMKRMGYNHRVKPYERMSEWEEDDYTKRYIENPRVFENNMRMGYTRGVYPTGGMNNGDGEHSTSGRGYKYDRMETARRHYAENHTMENQKEFNTRLNEFMDEAKQMLMDAVKNAEPNERQMYGDQIEQIGRQMKQMR